MQTIRGLFFDLDGTLADTLDANVEAYKKAIQEIGKNVTTEQLTEVFGMRYDVFLKQFFPEISDAEIEKVRELKGKYYPDFLHLSKPHNQLIDFIKTLRDDHVTVLVTMAQRKNAVAVLESMNIENLFDFIITGEEVQNPKPHPESYLKALEVSGVKPDQALAFEDSPSGIASAKAAGITTLKISIPNTGKSNEH